MVQACVPRAVVVAVASVLSGLVPPPLPLAAQQPSSPATATLGDSIPMPPGVQTEVLPLATPREPLLDLDQSEPLSFVNEPIVDRSWTELVRIDSYFSRWMLDFQNRQTDKQLELLQSDFAGLDGPSLIVGAQMRASILAAGTTRANKFSYLGRFPADFVGKSATDARMTHANLMATGHFGPYAQGYFETLFSDVFTFPTFNQGSYQVRQAYVVLGNLEQSPFYAFLGKKNVSFGDMGTLSPFSQAMTWHYFGALAEGIGVGYFQNGFHLNATALNGGRGIRVADSNEKGHLNNFAVNATYEWVAQPDVRVKLGAGYLRGTIYDAGTAEHTDPNLFGSQNPAWDVNLNVYLHNLRFGGEFVQTIHPWPVTGREVIAYRTEGAYDFWFYGRPSWFSISWSEGIQGPPGSEFEFNRQLVLGWGVDVTRNALLTLEYVHSQGFAPLINITTASDREVNQYSAVAGIVLVL